MLASNLCPRVQVREYVKVFWSRREELADHDRIMAAIEKGEQKIKRREDIKNALDVKVGVGEGLVCVCLCGTCVGEGVLCVCACVVCG